MEAKNSLNSGVEVKKEYGECVGCFGLQDKISHLERKVAFIELEKLRFADEVGKLKQRNAELERIIQDSKEGHDKLMSDYRGLNCEKKKAESDLEIWRLKCKGLEFQVMELEKKMAAGTTKADYRTTPTSTPSEIAVDTVGFKRGLSNETVSTVKRSLFQNEFLSTPGITPPVVTICIDDSDEDGKNVHEPLCDVDCCGQSTPEVVDLTEDQYELIVEHQSCEEETGSFTSSQSMPGQKRKLMKRVAHILSSESESNDNIPLSRLWSMNQSRHTSDTVEVRKPLDGSCYRDDPRKITSRRRLRRMGDIEHRSASSKRSRKSSGNQKNVGISKNLNDTLLDDEMELNDSNSEDESLGGFIVPDGEQDDSSSDDCSDGEQDDSSSDDCSDGSRNASKFGERYKKILSSLQRERRDKLKWEYETDMLADFGKSAELCMKAVCVLYRQQSSDEKSRKATLHRNGRGFSQYHAAMGTSLAEFLTGGNHRGDMTKTMKELQKFNSKGVEQCQELARHYSKQLFEIYKNEEDPFFHP